VRWDETDLFCKDLPTTPQQGIEKILVTGATGYIGGRLVPELLNRGYKVRVMLRGGDTADQESTWQGAEAVIADALDLESVRRALHGIHTAYYLIHSLLLGQKEFESADLHSAVNFRKASEENQVGRIIYLGGLGDIRAPLSPHLRSRIRVADELTAGSVPTTILRAAVIIGSGSASYEIIEHLVKNSPIFFIPLWAKTRCQPIAIRDVIKYLVGVLEAPETSGKSFDIGGPDILSYERLLRGLADVHGKRRLFLPSLISNLKLYGYFASLLTPVPAPMSMSLLEGCSTEVICQNDDIHRYVPFQPIGYKEAVLRALSREERDRVYTRWSDAYPPAHELAIKLHELEEPPNYTGEYSLLTAKSASTLFPYICRVGGKEGWFNSNFLWRLRGVLDRVLMGVGTLRGRRSSSSLMINDVIDFWRVENLKQDEMLLLRAEMKLPGRAWLEFRIDREGEKNRLSVKAFFQTRSIFGKAYWYAFLPFHIFIFRDLISQIEKKAQPE